MHTTLLVRTMNLYIRDYTRGPYTLYTDSSASIINTPVPNKWLPHDRVDPDTGKVIHRGPQPLIVGIVDFMNRITYGFGRNGGKLYMFHPMDSGYPPFIVGSRVNPGENIIAFVSFEHWTDIWPRGGIQKQLGPVGSMAVESNALLWRAWPHVILGGFHIPEVPTVNIINSNVQEWDHICNIDPLGCQDVDDILCWRKTDTGMEFAIAIADVSAWVSENSSYDSNAAAKGQSLYVDGVPVIPMLPPAISDHAASLRCDGIYRPVLAYIYELCDCTVVKTRWECMQVRVHAAYTYESVPTAIAAKIMDLLTTALGKDIGTDSHEWIMHAMVAYNVAAATVLRQNSVGILRSHAGLPVADNLVSITGCRDLAFLGASSGTYVSAETTDVSHAGLGLSVYCHASSPLRRYADLVNQRWLMHCLYGRPRPNTSIAPTHLNIRNHVAKMLDRDCMFLANLRTDSITSVCGFVVRSREDGTHKIYVPVWKRCVRATGNISVGSAVTLHVHTNLRSSQWSNRIVCSASPAAVEDGDACDVADGDVSVPSILPDLILTPYA